MNVCRDFHIYFRDHSKLNAMITVVRFQTKAHGFSIRITTQKISLLYTYNIDVIPWKCSCFEYLFKSFFSAFATPRWEFGVRLKKSQRLTWTMLMCVFAGYEKQKKMSISIADENTYAYYSKFYPATRYQRRFGLPNTCRYLITIMRLHSSNVYCGKY